MTPSTTHHLVPTDVPCELDDFGDLVPPTPLVRPADDRGPLIQWLNGAQALLLPADGSKPQRTTAIGAFLKCGVHPDLDVAMGQLGAPRYTIQYRSTDRTTGKQNKEDSWHLPRLTIFPLTCGLLSIKEMERDPARRIGLAYGREKDRTDSGAIKLDAQGQPTDHPKLLFKVLVQELLEVGYQEPLIISLKGMICFRMISALRAHLKAVDTYNAALRTQRSQALAQAQAQVASGQMSVQDLVALEQRPLSALPFVGLSVTLVASEEEEMVGKEKKSPIYPMLADIPSPITREYLLAHRMPKELLRTVLEPNGLLEHCVLWSLEQSDRIANNEETGEHQAATTVSEEMVIEAEAVDVSPGAVATTNGPAPAAPTAGAPTTADPLVNTPQITWITDVYCATDQELVAQVCAYFGVAALSDLRRSQFQELVTAKRTQDAGQAAGN